MTAKHIRTGLFSAAVALALAFGAAQALASPGPRAAGNACPLCQNGGCNCEEYCAQWGGWGFCNQRVCQCF